MKSLLKKLWWLLKKRSNQIDWATEISKNTILGSKNVIKHAIIVQSNIGQHNFINQAQLFSSTINDHCSVGQYTQLFNTRIKQHVQIGGNSIISNSIIDKFTYCRGFNQIFHTTIGSFCSIAEQVVIGHADHPTEFISTSPLFYKKDNPFNVTQFVGNEFNEYKKTFIGHDVWIGSKAYIKSGVQIGIGAVIGAGAVVTKDVPPYAIVGGVPAKIIRFRFNDVIIQQLLQQKWWEWPEDLLKSHKSYLSSKHFTDNAE